MTTNAREEAAAKALADRWESDWDSMDELGREGWLGDARAVLAAADGVAGVPLSEMDVAAGYAAAGEHLTPFCWFLAGVRFREVAHVALATPSPAQPQPAKGVSDERKAFEAWYEGNALPGEADCFRLDSMGDYAWSDTAACWEGWQARAALAAFGAVPEEVRKDAERYRWLRSEHERFDPICHLVWKRNGDRNCGEWVNTDSLDASIDRAQAAQRREGGSE